MFKIFKKKNKNNDAFDIPSSFKNESYKKLEINYDNFFDFIDNANDNLPMINKINRVSFELSNLCNYSNIHKKCPTSCYKEKVILPSSVVYKVIDELATVNFDGVIAFHRYNEPLIDPRLFDFIEFANKKLPNAKILILTNGFYLTQELLDELNNYNIWCIAVSSYSLKEHGRLIKLKTDIPYYVFFSLLDDRECIYDRGEKHCNKPCTAPLSDINIACTGVVNLCCLDWQNRFNFGSLHDLSLTEIINSEKFIKTCENLRNSKRVLAICKRCDWNR